LRRLSCQPIRAFSSAEGPFGTDHWRHQKNAFIKWSNEASAPGTNKSKREFYGFISLAYGDADTNKDGKINLEEFDRLLEMTATVPRRFGLAPQSTDDLATRLAKRKVIFDEIDTRHGKARGFIALDQFVEWSYEHIAGKVGAVPKDDVGLYNYQDYTKEQYMDFIKRAVDNPNSYERSTFYNFILSCFVEADAECKARVSYEQFDKLLDRAAAVPRHFGLAPTGSDPAKRKELFESMQLVRDGKKTGIVNFRMFWEWTLQHTAEKLKTL